MWLSIPSARILPTEQVSVRLGLLFVSEPGKKRPEAEPDEISSSRSRPPSCQRAGRAPLLPAPSRVRRRRRRRQAQRRRRQRRRQRRQRRRRPSASTPRQSGQSFARITCRPLLASSCLDVYGFQVPLKHVITFRNVRKSTGRDGTMWLANWNSLVRAAASDSAFPAGAASLGAPLVACRCSTDAALDEYVWRARARRPRQTYWQLSSAEERLLHLDHALVKQIDWTCRTSPSTWALRRVGLRRPPPRAHHLRLVRRLRRICQSLNFIAAVFLLVGDEEGAFWLLAALCRSVVADYHTHHMSGLRIDTALFASLVAATMPKLHEHFEKLEVPIEILASQWWLCLYANVLPTATLLRAWGVYSRAAASTRSSPRRSLCFDATRRG